MTEPKHGTRSMKIEETPGTKWYCQCGWSETLPYCDGAHSRLGVNARPIRVEITEAGRKSICQCHRSATPPWCDGTHKNP